METTDRDQSPEITWVGAPDNPWGVPVLDVRSVTLGMLSVSKDPQCAANAVSYGQDDGTSFIGANPPVSRTISTNLRFRIDRMLADGVLFIPEAMEQKWALYCHQGRILCIRGWLRQVWAVAEVQAEGGEVEVTAIRGTLTGENEEADLTVRLFDYLIRSHALGIVWPVPLPGGMELHPKNAALWCMSFFGNLAHFATPHPLPSSPPEKPLRTHSLLHIAVAQGNAQATEKCLRAGIPVDLLANDGLAPLHWALARDGYSMLEFLLEHGSPVDVRSAQGATPLMNAIQDRSIEKTTFLLDRGADPNATDHRGFTALHRAAEMGQPEIVRLLLSRGAARHPEAEGQTPRSLAELRGEPAIVDLLSGG